MTDTDKLIERYEPEISQSDGLLTVLMVVDPKGEYVLHSTAADTIAAQQKRIAELEHATDAFAGAIAQFVKEKHGGNLTREDFLTLINEPNALASTGGEG